MTRRAALFLALAACGAPPVSPSPRAAADAGAVGAPIASTDAALPSFETLAGRGAVEAPLMRELLRTAEARSPDVRADRDLCVRAIVGAAPGARSALVDQAGAVRGEATSSLVPPKGPVCLVKGETIHLEMPRGARAVLFGAP